MEQHGSRWRLSASCCNHSRTACSKNSKQFALMTDRNKGHPVYIGVHEATPVAIGQEPTLGARVGRGGEG
jgi:hypothetical protein